MQVVMASVIMLMIGCLCGYMVGYCVRDDQKGGMTK